MRYVFKIVRWFSILAAVVYLQGCADNKSGLPEPSSVMVGETSDYPAVVKIVMPSGSYCTGTFVSQSTALTAAHCANESGTYRAMTAFGTFYTANRLVMGSGSTDDPSDIALLIFNIDPAKVQVPTYPIGRTVASGDVVRMVGYGCSNFFNQSGGGVKRTGTNMIYQINSFIQFLTPVSSSDMAAARGLSGPVNRAAACFGDSGGPILKTFEDGSLRVAGVAHAGGVSDGLQFSEYIHLNQTQNYYWLRQANITFALGIQGL